MSKAFAARRVERLRPRVEETVTGLLGEMIDQGEPADLVTQFAHPLPATVICEMRGIPAGGLPARSPPRDGGNRPARMPTDDHGAGPPVQAAAGMTGSPRRSRV